MRKEMRILPTMAEVRADGPDTRERAIARWVIVTQLVTHGAQHRSEAATLLTNYGQSPGDLDFFLFIFQRR